MTADEFKKKFPTFQNTDSTLIEHILQQGSAQLNALQWGTLYQEALAYWTAAQLVLKGQEDQTLSDIYCSYNMGRVQLKQDPALAKLQMLDPMLKTIYGQHFYALKRTMSMGALCF